VKPRFLVGLVVVFLFCLSTPHVFAVDGDEAQDAINSAESQLNLVYGAVLEAESVGADVSGLLVKLNNSSVLLSEAVNQYRIGNFSEAKVFAVQCFDSLNGVDVEADVLRDGAVFARKQLLFVSAIESAFGIGIVLYVGFFGWRFFRKKYYRRVLEMKPEVQADDSG
jgi:hypothetical protein